MGKKKNNKKSNKKKNKQVSKAKQNNQKKQNKPQFAKKAFDEKNNLPKGNSSQVKDKKVAEKEPLVANQVALAAPDIEENAVAQESFKDSKEKFKSLKLSKETICVKLDDLWNFISETRKISVPLIILIYTAVVVAITIPVEHANVMRKINRQTTLVEQMAAPHGGLVLEKDVSTEVSSECKVTYRGYEFTKSVKAQNSNQFGNAYENNSENNTYLDIKLEYTNTGSATIKADKAALMTVKSGQSQYLSFAAIETDDGKNIEFSNSEEIESGETVQLHYIFDVPKSLQSSDEPLKVDAVIDNTAYSINLR